MLRHSSQDIFGKGQLMTSHSGNALSVFYTGKGDNTHAQKIVQQSTTEDYDSWGRANDVVFSAIPSDRPAAPSITKVSHSLERDQACNLTL